MLTELLHGNIDYIIFGILGLMSLVMLALVIERVIYFANVPLAQFEHIEILKSHLTKNLTMISTIGANAPYIGLLGTVIGILLTFEMIGNSGEMNVNEIMVGLALALQATAAGLLVAIPSMIAYNLLMRKVDVNVARWQALQGNSPANLAADQAVAGIDINTSFENSST